MTATLRSIAEDYIHDGWALVPIPAGHKAATGPWNVTSYAADDITEGIAAKCGAPSGGRVCVDHDMPSAVVAARILLPHTRLEGRAGRPDSHAWFICPDAKHLSLRHLKDAAGVQTTIIEILATGQYAILPPTVHPSGEVRAWAQPSRKLLEIGFTDLKQAVTAIGIACLIAEHWPGKGARHEARLALAGYLCRCSLPDLLIHGIGEAVETLTQGDLADWSRACSSTLATKSPTTGAPTLADHLDRGAEVIRLIDRWMGKGSSKPQRSIRLTPAATITPQPVLWLWEGRIPAGSFGLLGGREGLGKSLTALSLVAQLTQGTLKGVHFGHKKSALITATEDSWAHVIVPRLIAAGADLDRVFHVEAHAADVESELSLPDDLEQLMESVLARGDVALMVLDPLISRLAGSLDTHKDAEVRRALEPLVRLAGTTDMSVVGIIHVNKATTTDPLNSIMGSRAFSAVSRFVLFVAEDPNDPSVRLFGQPKSNLGPSNQNTLTFKVEDVLVMPHSAGDIHAGRVIWTGHDPRSIREILQEANQVQGSSSSNRAAATTAWLNNFLTQHQGSAESESIKTAAKAAGHSERHLRQAHKNLNLMTTHTGFPRRTLWTLSGVGVPVNLPGTQP